MLFIAVWVMGDLTGNLDKGVHNTHSHSWGQPAFAGNLSHTAKETKGSLQEYNGTQIVVPLGARLSLPSSSDGLSSTSARTLII